MGAQKNQFHFIFLSDMMMISPFISQNTTQSSSFYPYKVVETPGTQ